MLVIKGYWMLRNPKATAFTFFELLKEKQQGVEITPIPTQIRANTF